MDAGGQEEGSGRRLARRAADGDGWHPPARQPPDPAATRTDRRMCPSCWRALQSRPPCSIVSRHSSGSSWRLASRTSTCSEHRPIHIGTAHLNLHTGWAQARQAPPGRRLVKHNLGLLLLICHRGIRRLMMGCPGDARDVKFRRPAWLLTVATASLSCDGPDRTFCSPITSIRKFAAGQRACRRPWGSKHNGSRRWSKRGQQGRAPTYSL